MVEIQVHGLTEVQVGIDRTLDLLADVRQLWNPLISDVLVPRFQQVFASDGEGSWLPRLDDEPHPLLRKTLRLFNSYTRPGAPGNVNVQTLLHLEWGSDVPYARTHEFGTSRVPARPVVGLVFTPEFEREVAEYVDDWFQGRIDRFGL